MSVLVTIEVLVTDLEALRQVCPRLGLEFLEGQTTFWSFAQYACAHAIRVKDRPTAYQIGLIETQTPQGDRAYQLKMDPYRGGDGLCDVVGPRGEVLIQAYGVELVQRLGWGHGWSVSQEVFANQDIELLLEQ